MAGNQIAPNQGGSRVLSTTRYFFFVLRVLGLAPLKENLSRSRVWPVYNLFLVLLIVGSTANFSKLFIDSYQKGDMTTQRFISGLLATLSIMYTSTSSILFSASKANLGILNLFINIEKVDDLLKRDPVYNNQSRRRVYIGVFCTFGIVFSLNTMEFMLHGSFFRPLVVMRYFMNMVFSVTNIQYVGMVLMMKARYAYINSRLLLMQETENSASETGIPPSQRASDKIVIKRVKHQWHPNSPKQRLVNSINTLRQAHNVLHQISEQINALFGFKILGNVLHILLTVVTSNYLLISRILIAADLEGSELALFAVSTFGWWCYSHFFLLVIAKTCTDTIEETNKMGFIVQKCMFIRRIGSEAKDEVRTFAKQLQSNKLVFTACGIFDLNMTLLLSVAGTVTTYTILLLTPDKK